MAVLYTPHFVQFFNSNGDPLNGGKLYTYAAGTTTPKATYTTEAGSVANANPVVLDSAGRAVVFLTGSYKFRLEDSLGNLIRETDNVTAFSTQASTVDNIVANFTEAVVVAADSFIFADASDSNATRRDTIQGILDLVPAYSPPNSFVRVGTSNGAGSTNTAIRRFTTTHASAGSDITYADSAANGASFTINTTGVYAISYTDSFSIAADFGISRNSTQLTTSISSITAIDQLVECTTGNANFRSNCGITLPLTAGDVIRPHVGAASTNGTSAADTRFTITRIS